MRSALMTSYDIPIETHVRVRNGFDLFDPDLESNRNFIVYTKICPG